jgi:hypothetical protein
VCKVDPDFDTDSDSDFDDVSTEKERIMKFPPTFSLQSSA